MNSLVLIRSLFRPLSLRVLRRVAATCVAIGGLALAVSPAPAAEQSKEFLEALRERGYFQYAIDYLDWMKTSPLVSAEERETIGYELGATLVDSFRATQGTKEREKLLSRAETELDAFLKSHQDHPLTDATYGKLSDVNIFRAGERLDAAKRPKADRKSLLADAFKFFDAASKLLEGRRKMIGEQLKKLGNIPQKEKAKIAIRDRLRGKYVVSKLAVAGIDRLKARAYQDDPKKLKEQLTAAADSYGKIFDFYENHRNYRRVAYVARVRQAQCYQENLEPKKALECYQDVLSLEGDSARDLKTDAYKGAVECWMDDKIKEFEKALDVESNWLLSASTDEKRQERWLALTYVLALAHEKIANTTADDMASVKQSELASALQLATEVAKIRNSNQENAREMIARLRDESGAELAEPTTFAEAIERAESEYATVKSKSFLAEKLAERIRLEDEGIAELEKQREAALKAIVPAQREAIKYFKLALKLADSSEDIVKINRVRYMLCFLYYRNKQYFEAAVIGDYLARQHPQSLFGSNGAQRALAAWGEVLKETHRRDAKADTSFETSQIASIAAYIGKTWPNDKSKTDTAYDKLARIMLDEGKPDEAMAYLKKISPDSDKLGPAYVLVGRALSDQYTSGKKDLKKDEQESDELKQLGVKAKETLADGIGRLSSGDNVSITLVYAAFYLARLHVNINEPVEAIAILENAKYGPLTVLKQEKHPALQPLKDRNGLAVPVYSLAVRAYIGGISSDADNLAKAQAAIARLESMVSKEKLSAAYSRMAGELRGQLDIADSPAQRREIAEGFAKFLRKMRDGKGAGEYSTLAYVLNQFTSLAQGSEGEGKLSPAAKGYYQEAVDTGQKIVDLVKSGKIKVPAKSLLAVKVQLGNSLGKIGQYKKGIKIFEEILTEKQTTLSVQMAAAKLYMQRGSENIKYYKYAIGGGEHYLKGTRKRIIWGFAKIGKVVSRFPKFKNTLHDSRYHIAYSLYRMGMASKGKTREKYLEHAHHTVFSIYQGFPAMGGPVWQRKYDSLLKKVQRAQRKKVVGLAAFRAKAKPAPAKGKAAASKKSSVKR